MNIWASKKDIDIKHLLLMLTERFQPNSFEIIDSPSDNEKSIRMGNIALTDTQLYVFTYGQDTDLYGVHIEYPNRLETNYNDTLEIYENISFSTLVNIMITNLEIPLNDTNLVVGSK